MIKSLTGHFCLKQLKDGLFRFDGKGKKPISCKKYTGKEISTIIAVIVVASIGYASDNIYNFWLIMISIIPPEMLDLIIYMLDFIMKVRDPSTSSAAIRTAIGYMKTSAYQVLPPMSLIGNFLTGIVVCFSWLTLLHIIYVYSWCMASS